jgi:hypothetical protein
VIGSNVGISLY